VHARGGRRERASTCSAQSPVPSIHLLPAMLRECSAARQQATQSRAASTRARVVAAAASRSEPPPAGWATQPLVCSAERVVSPVERPPQPSWASFSGAAGGDWSGSLMAASPFTGAPEALRLDSLGKPSVLAAATRRASVRRASAAALAESHWWPAADGQPQTMELLARGLLAENDPGLVVFEDGAFSAGPSRLSDALGSAAAPPTTATADADASGANDGGVLTRLPGVIELEACLPLPGGRLRVRVRSLLALRRFADVAFQRFGDDAAVALADSEEADDLLMQQLRCVAQLERWIGPPPAEEAAGAELPPPPLPLAAVAAAAAAARPLIDCPRIGPAALCGGEWAAFVRSASPSASFELGARHVHEAYEAVRSWSLLGPGRPYDLDGEYEDGGWEEENFDSVAPGSSAAVHSVMRSFAELDAPQSAREIFTAEAAAAAEAEANGDSPAADDDESELDSDDGDDDEEGSWVETGSTLWLPGGITASVQLGSGPAGDGLTVSAGWLLPSLPDGQAGAARTDSAAAAAAAATYVSMEREYDGDGALVEVRYVTCSRPGAQGRLAGGG